MKTFALTTFSVALGFAYCSEITASDTFPVMLAHTYRADTSQNKAYWISEKYDGIRAIWTGKKLLTRNGNPIDAPGWFTESLPDFPMDGEIWAGYGHFNQIQSLIHRQEQDESVWRSVQYRVFDRPVRELTFEQRYLSLLEWFETHSPPEHIQLVRHYLVRDKAGLNRKLQEVLGKGGEGLVLRDPERRYVDGRDEGMLKLKPYQDDEAVIIGYREGKGKYSGMVGALIVKDKNNKIFAIGSGLDDLLRSHPPKIGERITFRYQGLTNSGIPRFARFMRVRLGE